MSGVRVLVGTRKGAFILTSDANRKQWEVSSPHFAGWEMYHLKGSPADPNRLYASQSSTDARSCVDRAPTSIVPSLVSPCVSAETLCAAFHKRFLRDAFPTADGALTRSLWPRQPHP